MKYFIITIDTEGDNLWQWKRGDEIKTENTLYLSRFQDLCNQYGFKPVWLSNWEMINDSRFVEFIKENLKENRCELGAHLHAWNNPPYYELSSNEKSGAPYLIEYPDEVMEEKLKTLNDKFQSTFGFVPITHRAGRWAMNRTYFRLLKKYGYKIDCSYTPGIDWSNHLGQTKDFKGPDYTKVEAYPHDIEGIWEVPLISFKKHICFSCGSVREFLKSVYYLVFGKRIVLRPNGNNAAELKWLVSKNAGSKNDYLMFMLHSSELMPKGSPTFPTEESIETLFADLEELFALISKDYTGITLSEYYDKIKK